MFEIEIKVKVDHKESLFRKLTEKGFTYSRSVLEQDVYFNGAEHEVRKKGHALRLRTSTRVMIEKVKFSELSAEYVIEHLAELASESHDELTFKGKKLDGISMSRKELQTDIGDKGQMLEILKELGFDELYPLDKLRIYFKCDKARSGAPFSVTACMDDVKGLGPYLEMEILTENEKDRSAALTYLHKLADELGLDKENESTRSYLTILQKKLNK